MGPAWSSALDGVEWPSDMPLISVIVSFSGEAFRSQVAWMLILSVPEGLQGETHSSSTGQNQRGNAVPVVASAHHWDPCRHILLGCAREEAGAFTE